MLRHRETQEAIGQGNMAWQNRLRTSLQLALLFTLLPLSLPRPGEQTAKCEYWVAPKPRGNDSQPGTQALPWATLEHAAGNVPDNNCTVWFMSGDYNGANDVRERFETTTTFKAVEPYKAKLVDDGTVLSVRGGRNMVFEGFEIHHVGQVDSSTLLVQVRRRDDTWSEDIVFRNNIFHDSYGDDVLKIYDGARRVTVEGNLFYNQGANEQHIDVNSVTDVTIQDNIFFNDFVGSGRPNNNDTKHYIIIKDSNRDDDGLEGSERITVRRNIFLNWEGGVETFVKVGNDGQAYFEAQRVLIENNLLIGNSANLIGAAFGVSGAKDVTFSNNTVVGDLPAEAYAFRVSIKGANPENENIAFYNNIWADPTRTMGADHEDSTNEFSDGDPSDTNNLVLDNNLYWNGGAEIPDGDLVSPMKDDARRVVGDPMLNTLQSNIQLPRWNGSRFLDGNRTIREEFLRLVEAYGRIPANSPAAGRADPAFSPDEDILGRPRTLAPDLGAYESSMSLVGVADLDTIWLYWTLPTESEVASLALVYRTGRETKIVEDIPVTTQSYVLEGVTPYSLYGITLIARDSSNRTLAESNLLLVMTTDIHIYLPVAASNQTG